MSKNIVAAIAVFCVALSGLIGTARAEVLLWVDLSVENEITIYTAGGASAITKSGDDGWGLYLDSIFQDNTIAAFGFDGTGNLSTNDEASDGGTTMSRWGSDAASGVNLFNLSTADTLNFREGVQAFKGSVTWSVTEVVYQAALLGAFTGYIYFPADSDYNGNLVPEIVLGEWRRTDAPAEVPLPAAIWLFAAGLGGLGFARRQKAAI